MTPFDPSPASVGYGWLLAGLLFLLACAVIANLRAPRVRAWWDKHVPLMEAEPSRLDTLDGVDRCSYVNCWEPAQTRVHAGDEWWPFCLTHGLRYLRDEARP